MRTLDIPVFSSDLRQADDGIWYGVAEQPTSYPSDGNSDCFAIEDHSYWFRHRNACIVAAVNSFPPPNGDAIFDLGGGNGFVAAALERAGFDVAVVEPGRIGASNAKFRGLRNVICATVEGAGFLQHSLPAVGLFDVIEHIEHDDSFLESLIRIMKPGGHLYATVPAYQFLWSQEDILAGHFRRYSLRSICSLLERAGFEVDFASYFFRPLPLPIFLLRTLPHRLGRGRRGRDPQVVTRDHAIHGQLTGRMLTNAFIREVSILESKQRMRFGGSCLVVARSSSEPPATE